MYYRKVEAITQKALVEAITYFEAHISFSSHGVTEITL